MSAHFDAVRVGPHKVRIMHNIGGQPQDTPLDTLKHIQVVQVPPANAVGRLRICHGVRFHAAGLITVFITGLWLESGSLRRLSSGRTLARGVEPGQAD